MTTARTELTLSAPPHVVRERTEVPDAQVRDRLADLLRLWARAEALGYRHLAAYYRERIVVEVWGPAA